ncbi:hypothetical protein FHX81_7723 [Saccharothrix saharensis]|uniref:Carbohydrate-binding module family 96 domain-containing protein n=1 Tax=Saccharothrix saharensis TaxID=571190 RepID=A0A543JR60_9PSEU|nr:DNRLRE domain-containing protein [Saccharothrix saharensis]TQM85245.1 hypothetical protein FHX81_7723 [Saccharothrix saharensis]
MVKRRSLLALGGAVVVALSALPATATAAPHHSRLSPVLASHTDSAAPHTAFAWSGQDVPLGRSEADGRPHVSRVYLTFDVTAFAGARISAATLRLQESTTADCAKRAIEVWETETATADPTWANAPERRRWVDDVTSTSLCVAHPSFDVAAVVRDAVERGRPRATLEVKVPWRYERDATYGRTLSGYHGAALTVEHNRVPSLVDQHRYHGGLACATTAPYPRLNQHFVTLEALPADLDPDDQRFGSGLAVDFALWAQDDPAARTEQRVPAETTRVARAQFPADLVTDGRTYSWQARVTDGVDTSAWSPPCHFTADAADPPTPAVTSANYPLDGSGWAPVGEPGVFTFDGGGDPDVAGFEWTWGEFSVPGCTFGELDRLICPDRFAERNTVRADRPGGTATVDLTPSGSGPVRLRVRSVDAAGRDSEPATFLVFVPGSGPGVSVVGGPPRFGQDVTLRVTPHADVAARTVDFTYRVDQQEPRVVQAGPDGTATVTFRADRESGHRVTVRSRSDNGWTSDEGSWSVHFPPWPGVTSEVYPDDGQPHGGEGVPGTFTFTPPPGWSDVAAYRYSFDYFEPHTEVAAGPDGTATITWTPPTPGWYSLSVYAVRPDGSVGTYDASYSFGVAWPR